MIRLVFFMLVGSAVLILLWIEAVHWMSVAIDPAAESSAVQPRRSVAKRAIGDYERIRDNQIQSARLRLANESAVFLERIGFLHGDLAQSRKKEAVWLEGHLTLADGLPRFTKPDEVDLYEYWQRLHESRKRFGQAVERFELQTREIENRFFKAVEGIEVSHHSQRETASREGATVRAAFQAATEWDRMGFDNFAAFQAAYR